MKAESHDLREQARQFIARNRAAALATVDPKGNPQVATVYCVVDETLAVYFTTRVEARKFTNLMRHPTVAMIFTNENELTTLQLSGEAERIESMELEQEVLSWLMTHRKWDPQWALPTMQLFEHGATNELAIIKVVPSEMTLSNFRKDTSEQHRPFFQKVI